MTALMYAVSDSDPSTVVALVRLGADINAKDTVRLR